MNAMPKVSVIMPCFNNQQYLEECLKSVCEQTLNEIEIICIDDGSTDSSLSIMRQFEALHSQLQIISKKNEGFGATVNRGIAASTGKYIAICETDDYVDATMYEYLYKCAAENGYPDVVRSDFDRFIGQDNNRKFTRAYLSDDCTLRNKLINPQEDPRAFDLYVLMQPTLVKRSFINANNIRLNTSPGASYQDNGYWFQVTAYARTLYYDSSCHYHLRRDNPNSSMLSKGKADAIRNEYKFIHDKLYGDLDRLPNNILGILSKKQFQSYWGTYNRIDLSIRKQFVRNWSKDFNILDEAGEIDRKLFDEYECDKLSLILNDPDRFYYEQEFWEKQWSSMNSEIIRLKKEIKALEEKTNRKSLIKRLIKR